MRVTCRQTPSTREEKRAFEAFCAEEFVKFDADKNGALNRSEFRTMFLDNPRLMRNILCGNKGGDALSPKEKGRAKHDEGWA
jgi:hypothetical protein